MARTFFLIGAVSGFVGVALGAFAAHALRGRLSAEMLSVFETGVRYQMYHALAILLIAASLPRLDARLAGIAGWCFTAGISLFSGSLYVLAVTGITTFGAITPIGGLVLLAGWACLASAAF